MKRIKIAAVSAGIIVLMLAAGTAMYYGIKPDKQTDGDFRPSLASESNAVRQEGLQEEGSTALQNAGGEAEKTQSKEPVRAEDIKIQNNSPEYDLRMSLEEGNGGRIAIRMAYYYNGSGTEIYIEDSAVPEIREIFRNRAESKSKDGVYIIENAWLNIKLGKVYFLVNGDGNSGYVKTDMYVVTLDNDAAVNKIFSSRGKYGAVFFSKDYRYLGYSYNYPPESSVLQETTLFEAIDCNTDQLIIKDSRIKGVKIGLNINKDTVYDYSFKEWHTANRVKLLQKPVPDTEKKEMEVLYDISTDIMYNKDGTKIEEIKKPAETQSSQETDKGNTHAVATDKNNSSDEGKTALSVLKEFYGFLGSESEYEKAMELLDETFVIRLIIFKQFGIDELTKKDISAEDAAFYSDMLKAASFDSIVAEESENEISAIYYYQSMELSPGNAIKQPMSAMMKKTGKGWRITLLQDADEGQPPFSESAGN